MKKEKLERVEKAYKMIEDGERVYKACAANGLNPAIWPTDKRGFIRHKLGMEHSAYRLVFELSNDTTFSSRLCFYSCGIHDADEITSKTASEFLQSHDVTLTDVLKIKEAFSEFDIESSKFCYDCEFAFPAPSWNFCPICGKPRAREQ